MGLHIFFLEIAATDCRLRHWLDFELVEVAGVFWNQASKLVRPHKDCCIDTPLVLDGSHKDKARTGSGQMCMLGTSTQPLAFVLISH